MFKELFLNFKSLKNHAEEPVIDYSFLDYIRRDSACNHFRSNSPFLNGTGA